MLEAVSESGHPVATIANKLLPDLSTQLRSLHWKLRLVQHGREIIQVLDQGSPMLGLQ